MSKRARDYKKEVRQYRTDGRQRMRLMRRLVGISPYPRKPVIGVFNDQLVFFYGAPFNDLSSMSHASSVFESAEAGTHPDSGPPINHSLFDECKDEPPHKAHQ